MRRTDNIPVQVSNTKFLAWSKQNHAWGYTTIRSRRMFERVEFMDDWWKRAIHRSLCANLVFRGGQWRAMFCIPFDERHRHRPIGSWQRIRRSAAGGMQEVIDSSCVIDDERDWQEYRDVTPSDSEDTHATDCCRPSPPVTATLVDNYERQAHRQLALLV